MPKYALFGMPLVTRLSYVHLESDELVEEILQHELKEMAAKFILRAQQADCSDDEEWCIHELREAGWYAYELPEDLAVVVTEGDIPISWEDLHLLNDMEIKVVDADDVDLEDLKLVPTDDECPRGPIVHGDPLDDIPSYTLSGGVLRSIVERGRRIASFKLEVCS